MGDQVADGGRQRGAVRGGEGGLAVRLGGLQEQGFAAQLESFGDAPGVAALGVRGGEQFRLAGLVVAEYAVIERRAQVVERGLRCAAEQAPPRRSGRI